MDAVEVPWKKIVLLSLVGTLIAVGVAVALLKPPLGFKQSFVPWEEAPNATIIAADYPDWQLTDSKVSQHDGTQFYVMARAIFDMDDDGVYLDRPHYRWQRPLLAWLVAPGYWAGGPDGLVAAFFVVNVAAIFVGAAAVGRLGVRFGYGPSAALWFALLPGVYLSLLLGVADVLSLSLFLVGCNLLLSRRLGWAAVLFVAACLAKETSLVLVAGVALWEVTRGAPVRSWVRQVLDRWRDAALLVVPALLTVVGWALFVRAVVPLPVNPDAQIVELTAPFGGIRDTLRNIFTDPGENVLVAFSWLVALVAAGKGLWVHRLRHPFSFAVIGSLLLLTPMTSSVIGFPSNAPRMLMAPAILAILMMLTPKEVFAYSDEHGVDVDDTRHRISQPSS
jgi:hypothetical protein